MYVGTEGQKTSEDAGTETQQEEDGCGDWEGVEVRALL